MTSGQDVWKDDKVIIRWTHNILLLVLLYIIAVILIDLYGKLHMFKIHQICNGYIESPFYSQIYFGGFVLLPLLLIGFWTAFMDYQCLTWIGEETNGKRKMTVMPPVDDLLKILSDSVDISKFKIFCQILYKCS